VTVTVTLRGIGNIEAIIVASRGALRQGVKVHVVVVAVVVAREQRRRFPL
jgi:hypothetical protein